MKCACLHTSLHSFSLENRLVAVSPGAGSNINRPVATKLRYGSVGSESPFCGGKHTVVARYVKESGGHIVWGV